jgi:uncharacterized protein YrzB (UPF0473 family)
MSENKKNEVSFSSEDFDATVTLTLDNDEEIECAIISIFDVQERQYIALLPLSGNDAEQGEVYLYRYEENGGNPELSNIETDEEFEIVSDAFDEVLDAAEYDELMDDDEEE